MVMRVRVGTLNLYKGAKHTYPLVVDFARKHDFDVLCFQEAEDWQDNNHAQLRDFAEATGLHYYTFGDSNTDANLVTYSRWPMRSQVHTEGFTHCAIQSRIFLPRGKSIGVWNSHLDPYGPQKRLAEAKLITAIAADDEVILGDKNNPSRQDGYSQEYHQELVSRGNFRYGLKDFNYAPIDHYLDNGYVDVAVAHGANVNTYPALVVEEFPPELRFDFAFVPEPLADTVERVQVLKDGNAGRLSDHFGVMMDMNLN